jgi:hypothetical protein
MVFEEETGKLLCHWIPQRGEDMWNLKKGKDLDNLYNVIAQMDDYVNPTVDGALSW